MQGKLFIVKVLWVPDVVKMLGPPRDLEKTLLHYGFFERLEARALFMPPGQSRGASRAP